MNSRVDSLLQELDSIEERRRGRTSDKWSEEENRKFIDSIKKQFPSKEYLTSDISEFIDWDLVSDATNRSFAKCRKQWFRNIRIKLTDQQNNQQMNGWNQLYDTSRLISILYDSHYESEDQIDWDFLKEKFSKLITYNNLVRVWRHLKISVPQSDNKTFKEKIEWLYHNKTCDEIVLSDDDL